MKLMQNCSICSRDGVNNFNYIELEINESGVYELICSRGHTTTVLSHDEKFEILFDIGALALMDGNLIQSVASISASVERFHEFCIRTFLQKRGVDITVVDRMWKQVKNMSERQLGAFYFSYINEFNRNPPIIDNKQISFRNNVIHKGYIPKYREVYDYTKEMFDYIQDLLQQIKGDEYFKSYMEVALEREKVRCKDVKVENEFIGVRFARMATLTDLARGKQNFDEKFKFMKKEITLTKSM
ncbi:hypothetical protein [Virgibacillus ndiopensis]|uniref:hypothetical protein n=1 Tax=Virgibacillus ndiopensis TaxID=2004408 RepID=UPI000C0686DB|nr:hypothetical protein [Virgibacillus ndiopensis]